MNFSLSLFFIHLASWFFLYIFPLLLVSIVMITMGLLLRHLIFTAKGNRIRHRKVLTYEEKRAEIEDFSIKITFIFRAFFIGLTLAAIILSVYLWLYEI